MKRDIAIDYLRSGITVSVVAHHAALAYNTFSYFDAKRYIRSTAPVVDTVRWMPLDLLVGWNDMFFMCLMFLVSGLFVVPSIERKGVLHFLSDRSKRLGIPFVVCVVLLSPLAYYPAWLSSEAAGQGNFLYRFFTVDGWSSGPSWFIWVLLAFCFLVAVPHLFIRDFRKRVSWSVNSPANLVIMLLAVSLLATVPVRLFVAPTSCLNPWGPLQVQTWRLLLYFAWFLVGVVIGGAKIQHSLSRENLQPWPFWVALGALSYLVHGAMEARLFCFAGMQVRLINVLQATVYSCCCTFTSLGALGMARFFFNTARPLADSLTDNAYGIYIFHYAFVIWMQYLLLAHQIPAALKFLASFTFALSASWLLTALLHKTPAKKFL